MRLLFLSLVLFSFLPTREAQSILLSANVGYSNHIANIDLDNPTPKPPVGTIGSFYDDAPVTGLKAIYIFNDIKSGSISFFTGILYEHTLLSSDIDEIILGEDLSINSLGFSAGIKKGLTQKNAVAFFTMSVEYLFSFYSGENNYSNGYNSESTYNSASMIRGVIGFEFLTSQETPIIIGIGSSFGYGTTTRGEIKFYEGDNYLESLAPTGDLILPDEALSFFLNVSYLIEF